MPSPESSCPSIRIGVGAGTADDRMLPGVQLAQHGELDYLVFECLAERTVARENLARTKDPERGYTPAHARAHRGSCCRLPGQRRSHRHQHGRGQPARRRARLRQLARRHGRRDLSCAVVTGDDVSDLVRTMPAVAAARNRRAARIDPAAHGLRQRLSWRRRRGQGPGDRRPVVITGRVSDPSLFLGPAMHDFGWSYDDWPRLAAGLVAGHLLECSAQVNGGCFADPGKKEVAGPRHVSAIPSAISAPTAA